MVAVADFEYRWAEGPTSETAAEFVRLHRTSLGGKLACRYVAAQRKGSTRTSACHSSRVSSCGRIRDYGSYLGASCADRWECRDHRCNRPAMAGHADLPKHGTHSDLHDGVCGASQRSSDR